MDEAENEIEAIQSIYGGDGEFELKQRGDGRTLPTVLTLHLNLTDDALTACVTLTVTLTPTYPRTPPELSLTSPALTRSRAAALRDHLQTSCESLLGQPMVLEVVTSLQEVFHEYREDTGVGSVPVMVEVGMSGGGEDLHTFLLHLDHMRARSRYVRTIQRWTGELGLTGRLIFMDKLILILLQGQHRDIKEYIHRQRTVSVDVDSRGRSCKERMMSVLDERPLDTKLRSNDFLVEDVSTAEKLQLIFNDFQLMDMYQANVQPLLKR